MASQVQETFRELCCDTGWCYAVFWKLQPQTHNLLAWEGGFYKPVKSLEMTQALSSRSQHSPHDDRIRRIVDRMSCHNYFVGEGIIGRVAFTNEHQWVFSSREREYPTGLQDQFAAGIQTIAVISVHLGVVQLGSTRLMSEDLKLVAYVKKLFGELHEMEGMDNSDVDPQTDKMCGMDSNSTTRASANTTRMPAISDVWSSLAARGRHFREEQALHDLYSPMHSIPGLPWSISMPSSISFYQLQLNHSTPKQECISPQGQPAHSLLHKGVLDSFVQYFSLSLTTGEAQLATDAAGKAECSSMADGTTHLACDATSPTTFWLLTGDSSCSKSCPALQTGFSNHPELPVEVFAARGTVIPKSSGMSCSTVTSQALSQNMSSPTAESPVLMHHANVTRDDTLVDDAINFDSGMNGNCNSQKSLLDGEMCDLLHNHDLGKLMLPQRNLGEDQDSSSLLYDNVQHLPETLRKKTEECPEGPCDSVLQRVFNSELDEFDNFLASLKNEQAEQDDDSTKSPSAPIFLEELSEVSNWSIQKASFWDPPSMVQGTLQAALEQRQGATQPVIFSSKLKEETSTSCLTVDSDVLHLESFWKRPRVESLYRKSESSAIPALHDQTTDSSATTQDEPLQTSKKRPRSGENTRQQPRDRQLIQDRVRELRTIIPSSSKCSIDALLEKTIKYMNFLQAVTGDADKWNASTLQDYEWHCDSNIIEGGASWAVELGGRGSGCPLVVEDLSQPQHMVVEMLCKETGIFMEIADTIKGLGLTILKGLLESRNEKIWARFVVKAVEGVHRVHVVWSLLRFLESDTRKSASK